MCSGGLTARLVQVHRQVHQPGEQFVAFQQGQTGGVHGQRLLPMAVYQQPGQRPHKRLMGHQQELWLRISGQLAQGVAQIAFRR